MLVIPNYQYDCTVQGAPSCPNGNNQDLFSRVCIGEVSERTPSRLFYSFWDILKSRNLVKKHIVLKIDTEGSEYFAFKYFPTQYLDYIDQIVMEVHFDKLGPETWGNLDILKTLANKFVNVNYHMNNNGCFSVHPSRKGFRKLKSHAFEVTLINRKLIKLKSDSRSFTEHRLNAPNANANDCQMQN